MPWSGLLLGAEDRILLADGTGVTTSVIEDGSEVNGKGVMAGGIIPEIEEGFSVGIFVSSSSSPSFVSEAADPTVSSCGCDKKTTANVATREAIAITRPIITSLARLLRTGKAVPSATLGANVATRSWRFDSSSRSICFVTPAPPPPPPDRLPPDPPPCPNLLPGSLPIPSSTTASAVSLSSISS
jgi:hypothetical protein